MRELPDKLGVRNDTIIQSIVYRKSGILQPVIEIGGQIISAVTKKSAFEFVNKESALDTAINIMEASDSILSCVVQKFGDNLWCLLIRDYPLSSFMGACRIMNRNGANE